MKDEFVDLNVYNLGKKILKLIMLCGRWVEILDDTCQTFHKCFKFLFLCLINFYFLRTYLFHLINITNISPNRSYKVNVIINHERFLNCFL